MGLLDRMQGKSQPKPKSQPKGAQYNYSRMQEHLAKGEIDQQQMDAFVRRFNQTGR